MEKIIESDILIIGAGPVGIFTAFEAGMINLNVCIIDCLSEIGGQCNALYPEKPIYDIPGHPKILAKDLITMLYEQAKRFHPKILLNNEVTSIKKICDTLPENASLLKQNNKINDDISSINNSNDDGNSTDDNTDDNSTDENLNNSTLFEVMTNNGYIIRSKAIIMASGGGSLKPNRPAIADIEKFEEKSLFYSIRDINLLQNKVVAIAGGGDSAVDWAINLYDIAKKIYLIHRRDKFKCSPQSLTTLKALAMQDGKIELVIPYQLENISGLEFDENMLQEQSLNNTTNTNINANINNKNNNKIQKSSYNNGYIKTVIVSDLDGNKKYIKADVLIALFGLAMNSSKIIMQSGIELSHDKKHIKVDNATMGTNIDGIYAVGDVAQYHNKQKLILTGFAEAALACYSVNKLINQTQTVHFEYSTTKFKE